MCSSCIHSFQPCSGCCPVAWVNLRRCLPTASIFRATLTWINEYRAVLAEHRALPCFCGFPQHTPVRILVEHPMTKLNVSIVAACLALAAGSTFAADDKKAQPAKPGASAPAASAPAGKAAAAAPAPKKEKKGGC